MIFNQYQEETSNAGWYIFSDAICIAGPFNTKEEAVFSLGPEIRKTRKGIWDRVSSNADYWVARIDIEGFYIGYCDI